MQISSAGTGEAYEAGKIKRAMGAAFASVGTVLDDDEADRLIARIERAMRRGAGRRRLRLGGGRAGSRGARALMEANHYEELKSYILYREDRAPASAPRASVCAPSCRGVPRCRACWRRW